VAGRCRHCSSASRGPPDCFLRKWPSQRDGNGYGFAERIARDALAAAFSSPAPVQAHQNPASGPRARRLSPCPCPTAPCPLPTTGLRQTAAANACRQPKPKRASGARPSWPGLPLALVQPVTGLRDEGRRGWRRGLWGGVGEGEGRGSGTDRSVKRARNQFQKLHCKWSRRGLLSTAVASPNDDICAPSPSGGRGSWSC
jgi:hypothetical protein